MNKNYEAYRSIRKDWGELKPYTKVYKSKKAYNRKNKIWKNEED